MDLPQHDVVLSPFCAASTPRRRDEQQRNHGCNRM